MIPKALHSAFWVQFPINLVKLFQVIYFENCCINRSSERNESIHKVFFSFFPLFSFFESVIRYLQNILINAVRQSILSYIQDRDEPSSTITLSTFENTEVSHRKKLQDSKEAKSCHDFLKKELKDVRDSFFLMGFWVC